MTRARFFVFALVMNGCSQTATPLPANTIPQPVLDQADSGAPRRPLTNEEAARELVRRVFSPDSGMRSIFPEQGLGTHCSGRPQPTVPTIGATAQRELDSRVSLSMPVVVGSLDPELVRMVMHSNRGQIRYCYEQQLEGFPLLEGKVLVRWVINKSGMTAKSEVTGSTVGNAKLETCVADRIKTWNFPKPKGGTVRVETTYTFTPGASPSR